MCCVLPTILSDWRVANIHSFLGPDGAGCPCRLAIVSGSMLPPEETSKLRVVNDGSEESLMTSSSWSGVEHWNDHNARQPLRCEHSEADKAGNKVLLIRIPMVSRSGHFVSMPLKMVTNAGTGTFFPSTEKPRCLSAGPRNMWKCRNVAD